jgi:hypothetical protein
VERWVAAGADPGMETNGRMREDGNEVVASWVAMCEWGRWAVKEKAVRWM